MPSITALLHTENDALRLGRALETLYACDDILIVDHGSRDATVRVAREYGARVVNATAGFSSQEYLRFARAGWILCLDPCESLTEKLAASLFEWKSESLRAKPSATPPFPSFCAKKQRRAGWKFRRRKPAWFLGLEIVERKVSGATSLLRWRWRENCCASFSRKGVRRLTAMLRNLAFLCDLADLTLRSTVRSFVVVNETKGKLRD